MPDNNQIHRYEPLFGSWHVVEEVGQGSFGIVYRVSKEELGEQYDSAVKLITIPSREQYREAESSFGSDEDTLNTYFEDIVKNIVKEVKVLHSLSGNTNIVGYHDHAVRKHETGVGWDLLIRMEYIASLRNYLRDHTLTREQAVRLGVDICSALEVCSRRGIVHRDIKDDNIFVSADGIFKLGDFGIARELSKSGRAASMRGTPLYMAPEVYRGDRYDGAVDIYSLGLVLYKLFNYGRMPFMPPWPEKILLRDNDEALDRRMRGDGPPMPAQAGETLGRAILKACSFQPEDRYASASEMKRELEQALAAMSEAERAEVVAPVAQRDGQTSETGVKTPAQATQSIYSFSEPKAVVRENTAPPKTEPKEAAAGTIGLFSQTRNQSAASFSKSACTESTVAQAQAQAANQGQTPPQPKAEPSFTAANPPAATAAIVPAKKARPRYWVYIGIGAAAAALVVVGLVVGVFAFLYRGSATIGQPNETVAAERTRAAKTATLDAVTATAAMEITAAPTAPPIDSNAPYDPPIEVTIVRKTVDRINLPQGQTVDDNLWNTAYRNELGIIIRNDSVTPYEEYDQKVALLAASGALPDLLFDVRAEQLQQFSDSGLLSDLTDAYGQYASPHLKEINSQFDGVALASSTRQGRLMALPMQGGYDSAIRMIWIRRDWVGKLGLTMPATMDGLVSVAKAFVQQDPDGNGKKDTVGFAIQKLDLLNSGYFDSSGFFAAFHAYPGIWIKNESNTLEYGSIQPEVKSVLALLNSLYQSGLIHPEFAVQDQTACEELTRTGKAGICFGAFWNSMWPLFSSKEADPSADWVAIPLVSSDGKPALSGIDTPVAYWHVARAGFTHPEALVKLQNLYVDISYDRLDVNPLEYNTPLSLANTYDSTGSIRSYQAVGKALDSGNSSGMRTGDIQLYDSVVKYRNGDMSHFGNALAYGPEGSLKIVMDSFNQKAWVMNELSGPQTPTMAESMTAVNQMQLQAFTEIVMGKTPVDAFDQFVEQWKALGGDKITQEVNVWYQSR